MEDNISFASQNDQALRENWGSNCFECRYFIVVSFRKQKHPVPQRNNILLSLFSSLRFFCNKSFSIFYMVSTIHILKILPSKHFLSMFSSARHFFPAKTASFNTTLKVEAQPLFNCLNIWRHKDKATKSCSMTQQVGVDHLAASRQIQGLARVPGAWLGNGLLLSAIQLKPEHQARL